MSKPLETKGLKNRNFQFMSLENYWCILFIYYIKTLKKIKSIISFINHQIEKFINDRFQSYFIIYKKDRI